MSPSPDVACAALSFAQSRSPRSVGPPLNARPLDETHETHLHHAWRTKTKRFVTRWSTLALGLTLLTACSYTRVKWYEDLFLSTASLNSIAVLPLQNVRLSRRTATETDRAIVEALIGRNPDLTIVDSAEAQDKLSTAGVIETYSQFLRDYRASRLLDKAALAKMGDTLGTDAILQGDIAQLIQVDGLPLHNAAYTKLVLRYSIFSLKARKLLWESSATVYKKTTGLSRAPEIEEVIPGAVAQITRVVKMPEFR